MTVKTRRTQGKARRSIRLHLIAGLVRRAGARRRFRRLGLDRADLGRADRAGIGGRRFQRQEGAASDRRRGRRSARARRRHRQGRRHRRAARRDRGQASLAIVVKTLNGLWARAARLEAEQRGLDKITFPADADRSRRRPRRQGRDGERDQIVRGPRQRPNRPEGAIARAGHAAERGNRRPQGAGSRQGQGNRAGGKGAGRRPPAL